jgi:hypothetical protein
MAHQSLAAVIGRLVGVSAEQGRDFGLELAPAALADRYAKSRLADRQGAAEPGRRRRMKRYGTTIPVTRTARGRGAAISPFSPCRHGKPERRTARAAWSPTSPQTPTRVTGYEIALYGEVQAIGGTSAVAPLYAGLFGAFGSGLGFVTPELWANHLCFNDITDGDNGQYRARVGRPARGSGLRLEKSSRNSSWIPPRPPHVSRRGSCKRRSGGCKRRTSVIAARCRRWGPLPARLRRSAPLRRPDQRAVWPRPHCRFIGSSPGTVTPGSSAA